MGRMTRFRFPLQLLLSGACMVLLTPAFAADNQCIGCHQDSDFYARYPRLYEYYQDWLDSPHKQVGATCENCHGGNPAAQSMGKAHSGVLPVSDEQSLLHFRQQPDTCGGCHAEKRAQFVQSKHYEALTGERAAPTCTTCHPAMNRHAGGVAGPGGGVGSFVLAGVKACRFYPMAPALDPNPRRTAPPPRSAVV